VARGVAPPATKILNKDEGVSVFFLFFL